jgi:hypothetical protein
MRAGVAEGADDSLLDRDDSATSSLGNLHRRIRRQVVGEDHLDRVRFCIGRSRDRD